MPQTVDVAGVSIPKLGMGTFRIEGEACARAVAAGLAAGYRHIDTAEMYGNEAEVGAGFRASGLARDSVFFTTKVWHDHLGDGEPERAAEGSLRRLGLDVVDLYLIHWPSRSIPVAAQVKALCKVKHRGLARAVGVANFPAWMLREAVAAADVELAVDQVEYHPYLDQDLLLAEMRRSGMGLMAYCPLARGNVAGDELLRAIAVRRGTSATAVALAWLLAQDGVIAIPKSSSPERLRENFAAARLVLTGEERAAIDALRSPRGRLVSPSFAPDWDKAAA